MASPEAASTSGFLAALRERDGEEVMHWTHAEKLGRMEAVAELLRRERSSLRASLCGARAPASLQDHVNGDSLT